MDGEELREEIVVQKLNNYLSFTLRTIANRDTFIGSGSTLGCFRGHGKPVSAAVEARKTGLTQRRSYVRL
jgi:hypothetical protein